MATLCHVFGVHRSSYKYWKNRPEKPDGRRAVLRSQVLELHGISHGSAGARSIATMATQRGYQMGRWLAGRLMKELPSLRERPRPEYCISYSIHNDVHHKTGAGLPARCPSPLLKSAAAPGRRPGVVSLLMMGVVTTLLHRCEWGCGQLFGTRS